VHILYLCGAGRSGGTLLGRLLDQHPEVFYAGELRQLWRPGLMQRVCACGAPIGACPFWQAVFARLEQAAGPLDLARLDALRLRHTRTRHALRFAFDLPPNAEGRAFGAFLAALYRAVAGVSGARLIVDSSRSMAYAHLLRCAPGLRVRALHLVRDPHGVAFSWQRAVVGGRIGLEVRQPHRKALLLALADWVAQNWLAERAQRWGSDSYYRLRYEDLLADPRGHLARLAHWLGLDPAPLTAVIADDGRSAALRPGHSVEGNIYRRAAGPVALALDEDWRSAMWPIQRRLVAALAGVWMRRYDYR
jgi:hypothetical protein